MNYLPAITGLRIKEYPHVTEAKAQAIWLEAWESKQKAVLL